MCTLQLLLVFCAGIVEAYAQQVLEGVCIQYSLTITDTEMLVCMYVCPKIYIRRALNKKVTVAPRSQTDRNVFSARLNRSVDKSAKRREDGRLFQILAPATAKLRSPNVLLVRRTMAT